MATTTFQYHTNSNSAPFFSDPGQGFIEAETPMDALIKVVKDYSHLAGLYSASIHEVSVENKMLARYLSARAHTSTTAPTGITEWKNGKLFVDNKEVPQKNEVYEEF